jgi:hypothetical protein
MNSKNHICFPIIGVLLILFMSGCAGFGKLKPQTSPEATLQDLRQNWDNYNVHYFDWKHCGVSLLFDPKDDDKDLIPADGWPPPPVLGGEMLSYLIDSARLRRSRWLYRILGPDNEFYGYLLARPECANVRVLDNKTLQVQGVYWIPASAIGAG